MKSGIYQILNKVNGKFYIGSAVDIEHRWQTHEWRLNRGDHGNKHLQSSFNKYGYEAFEFQVLEYCEKDQLRLKEQTWIDWTNATVNGYNKRIDATNNNGIKHTEITKEKHRLSMAGFKHSEASLEKMRIAQSQRSLETRKKLSKSKMGHIVSNKTKIKIGISNNITKMAKLKMPAFFEENRDLYV